MSMMMLGMPLVERMGWTLVHFLWQGAAVAAVLWMALWVLERKSAQARYALSIAALGLMMVLPAATFSLVQVREAASASERAAAERVPVANRTDSAVSAIEAALPVSALAMEPGSAQPVSAVPHESVAALRASVSAGELASDRWTVASAGVQRFMPWLVALWAVGVGILSLWNAGGWYAAQRLRTLGTRPAEGGLLATFEAMKARLGLARPVRLLQSALVHTPMVIGWWQPVVLVPAAMLTGLSPLQIQAILAHELAHVRRHDYLVNLLQTLAETLLFYHPGVWWVSRQMRQEREHCCDDLAAAVAGGAVDYAETLLRMEELRARMPALAVGMAGGRLLPRVRRLLGQVPQGRGLARRSLAAVGLAVMVVVLPLVMRGPTLGQTTAASQPGTRGAAAAAATRAVPHAARLQIRFVVPDKDNTTAAEEFADPMQAGQKVRVARAILFEGSDFSTANASKTTIVAGHPIDVASMGFLFTPEGRAKYAQLTAEQRQQPLALIVDGKLLAVARQSGDQNGLRLDIGTASKAGEYEKLAAVYERVYTAVYAIVPGPIVFSTPQPSASQPATAPAATTAGTRAGGGGAAASPASQETPLTYQERLGRAAVEVANQNKLVLDMIRELGALEKLDAARCFSASESALLIGTSEAALPLLERLAKENPGDKTPGLSAAVGVVAQFRIGTAARYSGQAERALGAYKAALAAVNADNDRAKSEFSAMALLYMAEIQAAQGTREQAIQTLEAVAKLPAGALGQGLLLDVYKAWAQANLEALRAGKPELAARARTTGPIEWTWMSHHLAISGLDDLSELGRHGNGGTTIEERLLEMASQSAGSKIDRDLARLVRANVAAQKGEHKAAYRLFAMGLEETGFLSLDYGAGAIRSLLALGQVEDAKKVYAKMVEQSPKAAATLDALLKSRETGPVVGGLRLSASVERAKVKPEEPIVLLLDFENVGTQRAIIADSDRLALFEFAITTPAGTGAALTPSGKQEVLNAGQRSFRLDTLAPGQHSTEKFTLNQLYDMTLPGPYQIIARRLIDATAAVNSNTLTVTVEEASSTAPATKP